MNPCIPTQWTPYITKGSPTHLDEAPRGLLFIGDPHLSLRRPGRRVEVDFAGVVLDKIEQAFRIATEERLVPVFLGDLFQAPRDATPWIFSQLFRLLLTQAPYRPLCNLGNHDKHEESQLTPDCSLYALADSQAIWVMHTPETCAVTIETTAGRVALLAVPYNHEIPHAIVSPCPPEQTVVITHADLDFGGHYPGAGALYEIDGARLLVNGHMHDTKPVETRGQTLCFNPGNITRQSVDQRDHIPTVWSWHIGEELPKQHTLVHTPGAAAFDMTGLQVSPASGHQSAADMAQAALLESRFAPLLAAEGGLEQGRTADGTILQEEIAEALTAMGWTEDHPAAQIL